jgi:hypothetical protein
MLVGFAAVVYKTNGAWNRVKDIFGFVRHTVASGDSATAMATVMASRCARALPCPAASWVAGWLAVHLCAWVGFRVPEFQSAAQLSHAYAWRSTALERTASELRQTVSAGGRVKED